MVAASEGPELPEPALAGALADLAGRRRRHPAAFLLAPEVVGHPAPPLNGPAGPPGEHLVDLGGGDRIASLRPDARRHRPEELVEELRAPGPHLLDGEPARQEPDPAVDVVADPAGAHDPAVEVEGGDPADRETVAEMDVRHRVGGPDDARERRDVGELLERRVVPDPGQELRGRVEDARYPHPPGGVPGNLIRELVAGHELRYGRHGPRRTGGPIRGWGTGRRPVQNTK